MHDKKSKQKISTAEHLSIATLQTLDLHIIQKRVKEGGEVDKKGW